MKFSIRGGGVAPFRATKYSAAFDLFIPLDFEKTALFPGYPTLVDFQVSVEIPEGWCGWLLPRSGLGTKQGLQLHNTVGLIDSDYRDTIKAILSLKDCGLQRGKGENFIIRAGDRIAQLVLTPCYMETLLQVEELSEPGTRQGGFGSTGEGKENGKPTDKDFSKLQIR